VKQERRHGWIRCGGINVRQHEIVISGGDRTGDPAVEPGDDAFKDGCPGDKRRPPSDAGEAVVTFALNRRASLPWFPARMLTQIRPHSRSARQVADSRRRRRPLDTLTP